MPHLYDPTLFSDPRVSPLPPTKPTAKVHHRAYSEKEKVSAFDSHSGLEQLLVRPGLFSPPVTPLSSIARPRPAMSYGARGSGIALVG